MPVRQRKKVNCFIIGKEMLIKSFVFVLSLFLGYHCSAQSYRDKLELQQYYIRQSEACGGVSELHNIKGSWKKSKWGDDIAFPDKTFPSAQYILLWDRIGKNLAIVKEGLRDLGGFEPVWYGSIRGNSFVPNGPAPASFNCGVFTYFCDGAGKILLGDEASSSLKIYINSYGSFCDKIADWNINNDAKIVTIYEMPEVIGKWKGLTLYEPKRTGGPGLPTDRAVVIGHNGQMPWHVLTQKQYLTGLQNDLSKMRNEQLAGNETTVQKMKENIAKMQASTTLSPEQKKGVVEKLELQLKNFQDIVMPKQIAATERLYNDQMKPIKEYLDTVKLTVLSQPAILSKRSGIDFKGFFAREGESGQKLFCFTTKYFTQGLPRYVPQFLVLYWKWGQDPASLYFAKQIEENFPVESLKALIDK